MDNKFSLDQLIDIYAVNMLIELDSVIDMNQHHYSIWNMLCNSCSSLDFKVNCEIFNMNPDFEFAELTKLLIHYIDPMPQYMVLTLFKNFIISSNQSFDVMNDGFKIPSYASSWPFNFRRILRRHIIDINIDKFFEMRKFL